MFGCDIKRQSSIFHGENRGFSSSFIHILELSPLSYNMLLSCAVLLPSAGLEGL
jgi:hypothetical protein